MSDTTHSLTDEELARLPRGVHAVKEDKTLLHPERVEGYVKLILRTGMHPTVLAHPGEYNLRVEARNPSRLTLSWDRPKKKGLDARCVAYLEADKWRWVPSFLMGLKEEPDCEKSITRYIEMAGRKAGIPGTVSPRALRHTAIRLALDRGMSIADARDYFNVSTKILLGYARMKDTERHLRVQQVLDGTG
jgi:integrase